MVKRRKSKIKCAYVSIYDSIINLLRSIEQLHAAQVAIQVNVYVAIKIRSNFQFNEKIRSESYLEKKKKKV